MTFNIELFYIIPSNIALFLSYGLVFLSLFGVLGFFFKKKEKKSNRTH